MYTNCISSILYHACTVYITTVGLKIIKKSLILKFDSVFSKISVRKFQLLKVGKIC